MLMCSTNFLHFAAARAGCSGLMRLRDCQAWKEIKDTVFMAVVPDDEVIPPRGHLVDWLEKEIPSAGVIYRLEANEPSDPDCNILLRGARSQ